MTGLDRDTSKSPDRTGVCCAGRCAPSQCETITGPSFSSLNKPDQERTPAYRDSSGSESPSGCLLCYIFRRLGGAIWGIPVILSQKHEGWTALPEMYDDGGLSGGTLERPALKRILADIEGHRIDTVVVYKVDRLTRSLGDFARIVEIFDKWKVSFVSVTRQFNWS